MPTLGSGTDTPVGTQQAAEDIYLEGGPNMWFQDSDATELHAPDSDGFYWGLSGTASYPVMELGCYDDLQLIDTRTSTVVTCAALGNVAQMQRRDALELQFTLKSLLPLSILTHLIGGGAVTHDVAEETEKMGLGTLPQNDYYHVFAARVYDETVGDYVSMTFHKVQWIEATPLAMAYGAPWTYAIRGMVLADGNMPSDQRFASWIRWDPSVL
jgi:hypothetical protein